MSAITDRIRHELTVLKAEGLPSMYVKLEDMEALLGEAKAVVVPSDERIQQIVTDAVRSGAVSWVGYTKDSDGFYTIPQLSQCHFQLVRAVAAALASSPALPEQGWISVKDELPEIGRAVFAYRPTAPLTEDPYFKVTFRTGRMKTDWQGTEHDFDCLVAPSHWQYATPPATVEQKEKQNG